MAHVTLIGPLRDLAGVTAPLEIDAKNIRQLFARLIERFPALEASIEAGSVAVAIDGQIYQDNLIAAIAPDSDVHLLPALAGG